MEVYLFPFTSATILHFFLGVFLHFITGDDITDDNGNLVTLTPEISYIGRLTTSYQGDVPPTNAGTYFVVLQTADTDQNYIVRQAIPFEIIKAVPIGEPKYTAITTSGKTLSDAALAVEGGTVSVTPSRPERGDTVTIKPKPDGGYEVDKIPATDKNGKPVEVMVKPDGTYTFQQPDGKVKIEVAYKPIETPRNNPFADVSEDAWYYKAVRFVQEQGLMNGYSDGRFGPNDPLSRAQLAQILFIRRAGHPGTGDTDVEKLH